MGLLETARKEAEAVRQGKHEAAFLKIRDEVQQGLNEGISIRALYRAARKEKQFSGSATAFTTYVRKYCKAPSASPSKPLSVS